MEDTTLAARDRLDWLTGFMFIRFNFIHRILGMLNKVANKNMETMGVRVLSSGMFELAYNPDFTMKQTDAELTWIFYHEVLHIALRHCTKRKFPKHKLGNIAHDLAVNELIPEIINSCETPRDEKNEVWVFKVDDLRKKPEYRAIKNKQTSEWYYDFLLKNMPKDKQDALEEKGIGGFGDIDDHSGWAENELADEKVRAKIKEIMNGDHWGNMSGEAKELIKAAQVKKISWENLLRYTLGQFAWRGREATRKKPNRRTGIIHPGYKRPYVDQHLVVVDTSGSMSHKLLGMALDVVNGAVEYAPFDLMQCDCEVQSKPVPFTAAKKEFNFLGRGGTDFSDAFALANKAGYKAIVIITDGEIPVPTVLPKARVIWVMPVGAKLPAEVTYGDRIEMSEYN